MKSISKVLCSWLYLAVSAITIPLVYLTEACAKGAGGRGPLATVSDARVDLLLSFVRECLNRVDDIQGSNKDADVMLDEGAWGRVQKLQDEAIDLGMDDNLLEIFGRVQASTQLNDLRRLIRANETDMDTLEAQSSMASKTDLLHRLSQATARLSVVKIDLEEQLAESCAKAEAAGCGNVPVVDPGDSETPNYSASEIIDQECARQAAIGRSYQLLDAPSDTIRERLQGFYDAHPDRIGTLRFTTPALPPLSVTVGS